MKTFLRKVDMMFCEVKSRWWRIGKLSKNSMFLLKIEFSIKHSCEVSLSASIFSIFVTEKDDITKWLSLYLHNDLAIMMPFVEKKKLNRKYWHTRRHICFRKNKIFERKCDRLLALCFHSLVLNCYWSLCCLDKKCIWTMLKGCHFYVSFLPKNQFLPESSTKFWFSFGITQCRNVSSVEKWHTELLIFGYCTNDITTKHYSKFIEVNFSQLMKTT